MTGTVLSSVLENGSANLDGLWAKVRLSVGIHLGETYGGHASAVKQFVYYNLSGNGSFKRTFMNASWVVTLPGVYLTKGVAYPFSTSIQLLIEVFAKRIEPAGGIAMASIDLSTGNGGATLVSYRT
jgi:hypothetical protein